jgi:hypothetical protein
VEGAFLDAFEEEYNKIREQKEFLKSICFGSGFGVVLPLLLINQYFNENQSSLTFGLYMAPISVLATSALIIALWRVFRMSHFDVFYLEEVCNKETEKERQKRHIIVPRHVRQQAISAYHIKCLTDLFHTTKSFMHPTAPFRSTDPVDEM